MRPSRTRTGSLKKSCAAWYASCSCWSKASGAPGCQLSSASSASTRLGEKLTTRAVGRKAHGACCSTWCCCEVKGLIRVFVGSILRGRDSELSRCGPAGGRAASKGHARREQRPRAASKATRGTSASGCGISRMSAVWSAARDRSSRRRCECACSAWRGAAARASQAKTTPPPDRVRSWPRALRSRFLLALLIELLVALGLLLAQRVRHGPSPRDHAALYHHAAHRRTDGQRPAVRLRRAPQDPRRRGLPAASARASYEPRFLRIVVP